MNSNPFKLTAREQEILSLLRAGLRNHEISHQLHVSPCQVQTYISNIFYKTGAENLEELLRITDETEEHP